MPCQVDLKTLGFPSMSREVLHGVLRDGARGVGSGDRAACGCGGDDDDGSDLDRGGAESAATGTEESGGSNWRGAIRRRRGAEDEEAPRTSARRRRAPTAPAPPAQSRDSCALGPAATGRERAHCWRLPPRRMSRCSPATPQEPGLPGATPGAGRTAPGERLPQDKRIEVTAVRLEDGRGFVLYPCRWDRVRLPVLQEGSAWKVSTIVGSEASVSPRSGTRDPKSRNAHP